MKKVSATDCKVRFGRYLEAVHSEPILIEKNDRPVAVLISAAEYERLVALENAYWVEQARRADESGWVGSDKAMELLKAGLSAET